MRTPRQRWKSRVMGAVSSIPDTELEVLERGHRGATLHLEMIPDDHWQQLFTSAHVTWTELDGTECSIWTDKEGKTCMTRTPPGVPNKPEPVH